MSILPSLSLSLEAKVKGSPLQAMKAHGGCGCKGPSIYTATALGRGRVASLTPDRLYPGESP